MLAMAVRGLAPFFEPGPCAASYDRPWQRPGDNGRVLRCGRAAMVRAAPCGCDEPRLGRAFFEGTGLEGE